MRAPLRYAPALILLAGAAASGARREPARAPLRRPLAAVGRVLAGAPGVDEPLPADEERVAGTSAYVLRRYDDPARPFTLYIGYYAAQATGQTIHSPRNCLPGAGWEVLRAGVDTVVYAAGAARRAAVVNRYVLARGARRALVDYWYQGRGRVAADEYAVKWNLLRDMALTGRSEEALVRLVFPLADADGAAPPRDLVDAERRARRVVGEVIPALDGVLPARGD